MHLIVACEATILHSTKKQTILGHSTQPRCIWLRSQALCRLDSKAWMLGSQSSKPSPLESKDRRTAKYTESAILERMWYVGVHLKADLETHPETHGHDVPAILFIYACPCHVQSTSTSEIQVH